MVQTRRQRAAPAAEVPSEPEGEVQPQAAEEPPAKRPRAVRDAPQVQRSRAAQGRGSAAAAAAAAAATGGSESDSDGPADDGHVRSAGASGDDGDGESDGGQSSGGSDAAEASRGGNAGGRRWHGVFCASGRGPFRFRTQVQVPQQQGGTHPLSLGASYRSAEEAARVHDLALLAILGPKAAASQINFPATDYPGALQRFGPELAAFLRQLRPMADKQAAAGGGGRGKGQGKKAKKKPRQSTSAKVSKEARQGYMAKAVAARLEQSLVKGTSVAAATEAVAQQRRADPLWCPPQQACGLCPPCRQPWRSDLGPCLRLEAARQAGHNETRVVRFLVAVPAARAAHAADQERRAQEKRQEKVQHGSKYWQTVQNWRRQQLEEGGSRAKQPSDSSSGSGGSSGEEEEEGGDEAGGGSKQAGQPPQRQQQRPRQRQEPQQQRQQQGRGGGDALPPRRAGGALPPQPEAEPAGELDWLELPPRATLARRHMLEQHEEQARRPLRQQLGWEAARFAAALEQEQQPGAMAAGAPASGPRKGRRGAADADGPADGGGQQQQHVELLDPGSWLARAAPPSDALQGQRPTDLLQLAALCRQGGVEVPLDPRQAGERLEDAEQQEEQQQLLLHELQQGGDVAGAAALAAATEVPCLLCGGPRHTAVGGSKACPVMQWALAVPKQAPECPGCALRDQPGCELCLGRTGRALQLAQPWSRRAAWLDRLAPATRDLMQAVQEASSAAVADLDLPAAAWRCTPKALLAVGLLAEEAARREVAARFGLQLPPPPPSKA